MWKKFIILLATVLLCSGCGIANTWKGRETSSAADGSDAENIHTDLEQIQEWFPDLKGIQLAEWEIIYDDEEGNALLPAPGSYTASGYIYLDHETAERYLKAYEWQDAEPDVEFRYISSAPVDDGKWMYSRQFDEDFRPRKFIGRIWFDGEKILFTGGR